VVQKIGVPNNPVRNQINTAQSPERCRDLDVFSASDDGSWNGPRSVWAGAEGVMAGLSALEAAVRKCAMISMQPILERYPLALPIKSQHLSYADKCWLFKPCSTLIEIGYRRRSPRYIRGSDAPPTLRHPKIIAAKCAPSTGASRKRASPAGAEKIRKTNGARGLGIY
jgi:hypothetical protein